MRSGVQDQPGEHSKTPSLHMCVCVCVCVYMMVYAYGPNYSWVRQEDGLNPGNQGCSGL